ncbi:hypothetical protein HMPREF1991_03267 [Hoylesella loescheii DSM 19665 = JCM 12249 = ATCC 15930]|uniref:Uncharacterized protein n=1 Tax=Hoylesella loescheii DSM 19665 = JCM 12249 = ATCC 15930 TaxID=1122985 RepID=A0A069QLK0_HOYLO|nr:hypothetical protein HMPREF1991_03267 [Hoylesella loescheii DSM 19665 = JCM 12249 = ATCC 15930]
MFASLFSPLLWGSWCEACHVPISSCGTLALLFLLDSVPFTNLVRRSCYLFGRKPRFGCCVSGVA